MSEPETSTNTYRILALVLALAVPTGVLGTWIVMSDNQRASVEMFEEELEQKNMVIEELLSKDESQSLRISEAYNLENHICQEDFPGNVFYTDAENVVNGTKTTTTLTCISFEGKLIEHTIHFDSQDQVMNYNGPGVVYP